jgi:1-deoxy-D-xylulose-5-phosphate synthase
MENLLNRIDSPEQLRNLTVPQLTQLAGELREFIIQTVSRTGGHLAPSLGTIELTLALYSVFNLSVDKVVWDVGHQAYAHKILTGRRDRFQTLRQKDGITGFPRRDESLYDAFGVGHASTSISAALGMAIARDLDGRGEHIIAVIGDGALTGGEAFEALNHAGDLGKNLIVILNDNGMSIDCNVGAMSEYLSRIRVTPQYNRAKKDLEGLLKSIPRIGDTVFKTAGYIKDGVRSVLVPGGLFEEMGFNYIGPLDGHNLTLLREVFSEVRMLDGPILVHVRTKKGRGYLPAELEPDKFHGVGKFDIATGQVMKDASAPPSYTKVFGQALLDLAAVNPNITAITAAMPDGTGLKEFGNRYPARYFDVGIAEEHAVTLAAGMAAAGKRPIVALYSTFAQRAYDQLLHDVCLQDLPVTLCLDRAGLVGEDGPTHHGVFDLSYLRHMPNMTVMAPKDENELRQMLASALQLSGPAAIRYPRGSGLGVTVEQTFQPISYGRAEVLADSGDIAFLAIGSMVDNASKAAISLAGEGIAARVVNMRFVKPLDSELVRRMAGEVRLLVSVEENVLAGGFGSAIAEVLVDAGLNVPLLRIGIPDAFISQGKRSELWELCGLLPEQIAERVKKYLAEKDQ